ncbi:MAG: dTDP-4-dehydrorhamnose reductase [Desulfatibacillaceae bacterium]
MRILITGGKGQLGADCASVFAGDELLSVDVEDLDIADMAAVAGTFREFGPAAVVNCAAYTAVDACETHENEAFAVNATGPANLAAACRESGAYLVHVSTDYVFSGQKPVPEPYIENDPTGPLSAYGRTKLAGERAVAESGCEHAILRTAWLYGAGGGNFLKTMLRLSVADPGRRLRVVDDQHGSPTWSATLAGQIAKVVEARPKGVFHATAHGHTTWYRLATRFLSLMDAPCNIDPCTTREYPTPAARPKNSILANRALDSLGLDSMSHWEDDLARFVDRHKDGLLREAGASPG